MQQQIYVMMYDYKSRTKHFSKNFQYASFPSGRTGHTEIRKVYGTQDYIVAQSADICRKMQHH